MKNIALITGASSGIGEAFVRIIDKKEVFLDEIWLIGTSKDRLDKVAKRLKHDSRVIAMDLSDSRNLNTLRRMLYNKGEELNIRILINSAGFGIEGPFENYNYVEMKNLMRVNIEALTVITYNCLNYMSEGSRIINISSSASFLPQPYFAIYAASKSYVTSLTRAIREEVRKRNIYVTAVCPGPVKTRFFDKIQDMEKKLSIIGLTDPMKVALHGYYANLRNSSVATYGGRTNLFRVSTKLLPRDFIVRGYSLLTDVIDKCKKRSK